MYRKMVDFICTKLQLLLWIWSSGLSYCCSELPEKNKQNHLFRHKCNQTSSHFLHSIYLKVAPQMRRVEGWRVHFRHITMSQLKEGWQWHNGVIITCSAAELCVIVFWAANCVLFSCTTGSRSQRRPSRAPLCGLAPWRLSQPSEAAVLQLG